MSRMLRVSGVLMLVGLMGGACAEPAGPAYGANTTPRGAWTGGGGQGAGAVAAAPGCGSQPVRMEVNPLSPYVYQGGDGYAYFDVWLQACSVPGATRQPLDIALVVDTSGSMGGSKIANARAAARYLLSVLGPRDRLSLVAYSSNVDILFPLRAVTPSNRGWMSARINRLHAHGMTNLGGGFDVGVQQLTGAGERQAIQRVILVSDGLANVGVTAPAALNGKAAAARQARVGVSTMGVGQRFNELLLQSLAEYGGGRYHYIKDAHALLPIFRQEIAGVQGTVATSVQITVAGCAGCQVVEAPGYALQRQGGQTHIVISDLAGGQRRKALVKVRLPRDRPGKRELAVRLAYHTARGARRAMSHREKVAFRITADRQKVRATLDKRIADRVAQVQASKDVNKAMKAYQFGNAAVAGNLLSGAAKRLERVHRATGSKRAQRRARQLRQAARKVRSRPSPASAPSRHLMKKMRYDAAESTRR